MTDLNDIHPSWIQTGGLALEVMQGKHDDLSGLDAIRQAAKSRGEFLYRLQLASKTGAAAPGWAVHPSWEKAGAVPLKIMQSEYDDALDGVEQAAKVRRTQLLQDRYPLGQRVQIGESKHAEFVGQEGFVVKINQKTINVAVGKTIFQCSHHLLTPVGEAVAS